MSACRTSCSKDERNKNESNKYFVAKFIVGRRLGSDGMEQHSQVPQDARIAELIVILEEIIEIKVEQDRARD